MQERPPVCAAARPPSPATRRFARVGRALLPLLALAALAACASHRVGHDADPQAALGSYRSFGILPAESTPRETADPRLGPLLDRHTEDAIGWTLRTRGYELRPSGDVDFLVTYRNDVQEEARIDSQPVSVGIGTGMVFSGIGIGTGWSGPSRATARKVAKGRLVIDVLDPLTRRLVWRGWTEDTLSPAGDPRRDIFAAVDRVLEQFPQAAPR